MEADYVNDEPVYAIFFPEDPVNSPRTLFNTVKDASKFANSPEVKTKGPRFRRFDTRQEALSFLESPRTGFRDSALALTGSDPAVPYKAPSRIEFNRFKVTIDDRKFEDFEKLVAENPRFLVNTSGDCPAIVQEGFRYNVLHIAARAGASRITTSVLSLISSLPFLVQLYATNEEDAAIRRDNIITGFLQTPDKGNLGTPLQIAVKFGRFDVVRVYVNFLKDPVVAALRERLSLNIANLLDDAVLCARYEKDGDDKLSMKQRIRQLFTAFYVPLYRCVDNSAQPRILPPTDHPLMRLSQQEVCIIGVPGGNSVCNDEQYVLAALAGPFDERTDADNFYREWIKSGSFLKRSDIDKGYERVGRELAAQKGAEWAESWFFLHDLCDLSSERGLRILEDFLLRLRSEHFRTSTLEHLDSVRRRLFDDSDVEDECINGTGVALPPSTSEATSSTSSFPLSCSGDMEDDSDDFCDASDIFETTDLDTPDNQAELPMDDSLMGITERLEAIQIRSPPSVIDLTEDEEKENDDASMCSDDSDYGTPPPSPPPLYLLHEPTKADNDLFLALQSLPIERLEAYPQVCAFVRKMGAIAEPARREWPGKDSPRCARSRSSQRKNHISDL